MLGLPLLYLYIHYQNMKDTIICEDNPENREKYGIKTTTSFRNDFEIIKKLSDDIEITSDFAELIMKSAKGQIKSYALNGCVSVFLY